MATAKTTAPAAKPRRRWLRRTVLALAVLAVVLLTVAGVATLWLRSQVQASLPELDGRRAVAGVAAPVRIERDGLGIPTIHGDSRLDVAYGLGFVHGQDRFFNMDLLRRRAAGELAGLLGEALLEADQRVRVHLFREQAARALEALPADQRVLLDAYSAGVGEGLASLGAAPFEYVLLRSEPVAWRPEDSLLVIYSLYLDLQSYSIIHESELGMMHDLLDPELLALFDVETTRWEAPLDGGAGNGLERLATPGELTATQAEEREPETAAVAATAALAPAPVSEEATTLVRGSNAWALSAEAAGSGRALLANDIHLALSQPNLWYRAAWTWPAAGEAGERRRHRVTGATLPGLPVMVVGSNGQVAWGLTSGLMDTVDLIIVEPDPADDSRYLTPDGPEPYEVFAEVLELPGGGGVGQEVRWTRWGPVVGDDHTGLPRALAWVAHEPGAVDLSVVGFETATTVDEVTEIARAAGAPAQNLITADAGGRVAWTVLGRLPQRAEGFDGRLPATWSDGPDRWLGLVPPGEVPVRSDPADGRLWSANNRPLDGPDQRVLGDGGYRLGARATQIRDALYAMDDADEDAMLALQLDDRALFLERWHRLLLEVLDDEAVAADPRRGALRDAVSGWSGLAEPGSAAYRLVRAFRITAAQAIFNPLTDAIRQVDDGYLYLRHPHHERPLWYLVSERPERFLPAGAESWEALLLSSADGVLAAADASGAEPSEWTWGAFNTMTVAHPVSRGLPFLGRWLDLPLVNAAGGDHVPRIQVQDFGANLRVVVSPGHEADGYTHMPGGQSGHPLSPHYHDSHDAWAEGRPTPFLPGTPVHTYLLVPGDDAGGQPSSADDDALRGEKGTPS